MQRILLFSCLLALPFTTWSQGVGEEVAAVGAVKQLFDGMRESDSAKVRAVFHPLARLQSVSIAPDGTPRLSEADINRFIQNIGAAKKGDLDEQIWIYDARIDGNMASVWTEYTFVLAGKLSHCGSNAFHLFKDAGGWKITQITDTRRKSGCLTEAPQVVPELHRLVDAWHKAAAVADEDAFFGAMAPEGVYIGTDATERWDRDTFRTWAQKAFERESAWAFSSRDRRIMVSADGRHAWWDELLDTWMGVCRGSGVLVHGQDGWKIAHYQLSLAVPNEKMDKVRKAIGK